ncbi:hypothetical protein LOK49_LG03G00289 [Camellia lanceoleosa]|uniref:Uncharacterized protein n=1 Tax=Camellia lanceoleosa TaxID=1840588 RepID=A0ACC0IHX4_9ERIC|nr:hypothetical protein LOK49_LG03G00289 [Camellia lanceoleosa]
MVTTSRKIDSSDTPNSTLCSNWGCVADYPFALISTKADTIVLTGLSGRGRTVLFHQMEKIKPVHIVDGHSCLQPKLDEFLPQAAGIVFVVDALEFLPNCRAASEYVWSNSSSDMLSSTCIS